MERKEIKYFFFAVSTPALLLISLNIAGVINIEDMISWIVSIIAISSVFYFSLKYLQSGGRKADDMYHGNNSSKDYFSSIEELNIMLSREIYELRDEVENLSAGIRITEKDRSDFVTAASKNISGEAINLAFKHESEKLRNKIKEEVSIEAISSSSMAMIQRLQREIKDLRLRSNFNLVIGMLITLSGLYFLWYNSVYIEESDIFSSGLSHEMSLAQHDKAIFIILSRVSILIIIEVFAYFFLRLYKQAISEIKYTHNELTNLESKISAFKFAYITDCKDSIKKSIEELAKTERNFILKRRQTSVELERAKSYNKFMDKIIKIIPDLMKSKS